MDLSKILRPHQTALATLALGLGSLFAPQAQAHPHAWVTMREIVQFQNNSITGIKHEWTFDEIYTAMAIEGLDTNKDGVYDKAELQSLAQTNIEGLKEYDYFTDVTVAGMKAPVSAPKEYWLEHKNGLLTLYLVLPLQTPLAADTPHVRFSVADPSFYIAFEFDKDKSVDVSGAPANCAASLEPEAQEAAAARLSEAFGQQMQGMGAEPGNVIKVECKKS